MRPFAPTRRAPAALLAVLAAAVGACSPEADAPPAITADAPVFSKADAPAPDAADHACRVVLRDLGRSDNGMGGYVTQGGSWVWTGHLDVAATDIANGARPAVLFRANGVGDWYEVAATATTGGTAQRPRYQVQLADHTAPLPSASGTSIASSRMEVVPFLHLADGSRLFDHNRNLDDLSNYLLNVSDGFSVNDDPAVCGGPGWMGNVVVNLNRDSTDPCNGGTPADGGFTYGTWVRERAIVRNVCFEVWQAGVTDWDNPNLWQQLDVAIYYRQNGLGWSRAAVNFDRRLGNNARYAFDLGHLDPFAPYTCPGPGWTTVDENGTAMIQSTFEYFIVVNSAQLPSGGTLHGLFEDYAASTFRQDQCGQQ